MRSTAALVVMLTLLFTQERATAAETLEQLKQECEDLESYWQRVPPNAGKYTIPNQANAAICFGYLSAISDLTGMIEGTDCYGPEPTFGPNCRHTLNICFPKSATTNQALAVFLTYARSHVAQWHEAEIVTLIRAEERHRGSGFLRVHGAPDDPLGIDDAYEAALVLLPPSAWQRGRDQDTPAMKLAADIVEHKGPGQRRNRNRLAFLAADQSALEDIQNVVRKKLAWASIVRDARGILQLPPAQEDDAKKKLAEQETAAVNAVRRGWKHLLLPQEPQPASPNAARGFDLEPVALTNRGSDPMPLAQLAWKKCEDDGLIVSRLGVLDNDLGKVWQPTQPHVSVRQLRDWFAQFPYLSKLREPQVLAKAISKALARSDAKYAIADRFDEAKGEYVGLRLAQLVTIGLNSDAVLVRREVADAQLAEQAPQTGPRDTGKRDQVDRPPDLPIAARPRRFYAKVTLDPNRPTPQISNIAQSILSELDRARGTTITLVLDIAAETVDGFSEDVETHVRDNAASLRTTDFGFEKE
jgi:hypothetical protein